MSRDDWFIDHPDAYTVKPGSPGTGSEYVEASDRRRAAREPRCDMPEAMAWLAGGLLFLGGIVVAVLSVKPWRW